MTGQVGRGEREKGRKGAGEAIFGSACGYGPRAAEVPFVTLFELDTLGKEELAGKQCDGWHLSGRTL